MTQPQESPEEPTVQEGGSHETRPFLSTLEARKYLGHGLGKEKPVAEETLRSLVERGIIHEYKREVGRGKLYDPDELDEALKPKWFPR
jgi:DNA-binding transcriptional ArsR family regulator